MLHTIEVEFDRDGNRSIDYRAAVLHVHPGDQVQWTSNYHLKVSFNRGTPFNVRDVECAPGQPSTPQTVVCGTRAELRGYHYTVHGVRFDEHGGVRLISDPGCPEIIVE